MITNVLLNTGNILFKIKNYIFSNRIRVIISFQSEPSNEAKAMELLELFETANRSRFNALMESLSETKQGLLVHYLQETLTDLKKSEIGSDFEGM